MNRLVREHYPVSKLPDDLREGFEGQTDVRVTIDVAAGSDSASPAVEEGHFGRFKHLRRSNFGDMDEVVSYVRSLRDEWAHRER